MNPGLLELLQRFLDQFAYEKERSQASNVAKAVGSVRNSVMSVGHVVTAVPGQLIHTVDNVVDNLSKVLQPTSKTMDHNNALMIDPKFDLSNVDSGASDNIPLRITLMFMDEVFDLRERNQWLRRHIVAVLRQILKAMFGDIVNRRIVEYFAAFTSPMTLSGYLRSLKDSLWPNGYPAEQQPLRDEATKMRTRVAAKTALFSSLSEELKRVIGSETSRSGLLMLFDMLQHPGEYFSKIATYTHHHHASFVMFPSFSVEQASGHCAVGEHIGRDIPRAGFSIYFPKAPLAFD